MVRLSFSQFKVFENCPLRYKYSYVDKIPDYGDKKYAHAGNVLHNTLEFAYNLKIEKGNPKGFFKEFGILPNIKKKFEDEWIKYKLGCKLPKDKYWLMTLNGLELDKNFSTMELKIFYPDEFVCYLDGVATFDDEIIDWKSSTRSKHNEVDYREQLLTYGHFYKRKIGRYPKTSTVYYLKPNNTLTCTFTPEEYEAQAKKIKDLNDEIEKRKANGGPWPKKEGNCFFCAYKEICANEKCLNYKIVLGGSRLQIQGPMSPLLITGLDRELSYELPSAHFIEKATAGKWDGVVHLFSTRTHTTMIGLKDKVIRILNEYGKYKKTEVKIDFLDTRKAHEQLLKMPEKLCNDIVLRDYQKDAVTAFLKSQIGIIEGGCAFGKTVTSGEIIRECDVKTLFVIDRKELLLQTKTEYETMLGVECGVIGMGLEETDKPVTLATYQTLAKHITKYKGFLNDIQLVIFDECLHGQTQIKMADGSTKTISNIVKNKVTDKVLTYNLKTKKIEAKRIINWLQTERRKTYYKIKIQDGHRIKTIECTPEHKLYTTRGYIQAKELNSTDTVLIAKSTNKGCKWSEESRFNRRGKNNPIHNAPGTIEKIRQSTIKRYTNKPNSAAWGRTGNGRGMSKLEKVAKMMLLKHSNDWVYNYPFAPVKLGYLHSIPNGYPTNYKIDFCLPNKKFGIEIDGPIHNNKKQTQLDNKKTLFIESFGWKIIRIRYDELNKIEEICKKWLNK